jgi:hypothetical protein
LRTAIRWRRQMVSALQLLPCRRCSLDWLSFAFSLSFYTIFFLTLTSKALRVLYLLDNDAKRPSSPILYTIAWHVLRKDLRDLRVCYWLFLLQFAWDGSTTTNIKMNTKWVCNTCRSHPTSKPLHDTFYVKISVTFECLTGFFFCRLTLLGMGLQQTISKWILNEMGMD